MAINLLSPISRMPFGHERGTPIWQLDINTFSWLRKQELTEDAVETLDFAWDMFMHEGQYAILSRSPIVLGKVKLIMISRDYDVAKLACTQANEFVYHIVKRQVVVYEKAS